MGRKIKEIYNLTDDEVIQINHFVIKVCCYEKLTVFQYTELYFQFVQTHELRVNKACLATIISFTN